MKEKKCHLCFFRNVHNYVREDKSGYCFYKTPVGINTKIRSDRKRGYPHFELCQWLYGGILPLEKGTRDLLGSEWLDIRAFAQFMLFLSSPNRSAQFRWKNLPVSSCITKQCKCSCHCTMASTFRMT